MQIYYSYCYCCLLQWDSVVGCTNKKFSTSLNFSIPPAYRVVLGRLESTILDVLTQGTLPKKKLT